MRSLILLLMALLTSACASFSPSAVDRTLLRDQAFAPPTERINAADVFALSPEMRSYLREVIGPELSVRGYRQGLIDALYSKQQLKIEYDSARTRNAAEAFAERSGNCLSLVIMTSAFAKEIGVPVHYQSIPVDPSWGRGGGLHFSIGHVNLSLARRPHEALGRADDSSELTIDFFPADAWRMQHAWPIDEATVLAMYMNNRAAEALVKGRTNDAYWWVREAVVQSPGYLSAYNTLAVVYRRAGQTAAAEGVLRYVLSRESSNLFALSNLALVVADLGHDDEAKQLQAQVARMEPFPPFHFLTLGMQAMQRGEFQQARDLFAREVSRDAFSHESHFWLAQASLRLGDVHKAGSHLVLAMEYSPTRDQHDLYAAKLAHLNARLN